jgi:hypothetical protein
VSTNVEGVFDIRQRMFPRRLVWEPGTQGRRSKKFTHGLREGAKQATKDFIFTALKVLEGSTKSPALGTFDTS